MTADGWDVAMFDWKQICEQNETPESGQDDLVPARGIFLGIVLSLPAWALIGWLVWRWLR
jgi:hypothetical protein